MKKIYFVLTLGLVASFSLFLIISQASAHINTNKDWSVADPGAWSICQQTAPSCGGTTGTQSQTVSCIYKHNGNESCNLGTWVETTYLYSDKVVDVEGHWGDWTPGHKHGGGTVEERRVWNGTYTDSARPYTMVCSNGYFPNPGYNNCRKWNNTPWSGHWDYANKVEQYGVCPTGSEIKPTDETKCRTQNMVTEHRHFTETTYTCPAGFQNNPEHNPRHKDCRKVDVAAHFINSETKTITQSCILSTPDYSACIPAGTCPTECDLEASTVPNGQGGQTSCPATDACLPQCNPNASQTIVSNTETLKDGNIETPAVPVSPINSRWTASISDATWIWDENPIVDTVNETLETFTRAFNITGTPIGATLDIAADNGYSVSVNNHLVGADPTEFNYQSSPADDDSSGQDTYSIPAEDLLSGANTITFAVTNFARENGTPETNPAGLLYKLTVNSNECPPAPTTGTIKITKYECPADTAVTRLANGVGLSVPVGCVLQSGAAFGYVHGTQTDANAPFPELNTTLTAGGSTNASGVLNIDNLLSDGRYLIIETNNDNQQLPAGDILGLYCQGDGDTSGTNDNQELTFVPAGGITNCVAYNKIIPPPVSSVTMCKTDDAQVSLSGWTLMLKGKQVQTSLTVPTNISMGVNSDFLSAGISYIAKVSGTWLNQGGANPVDAEYSTTDNWTTYMDGYTGYGTDILETQINSIFDPDSNWGIYNGNHAYAQSFISLTDGPVNFRIFDGTDKTQNEGWFGDNSGTLSIDINEGYAGITKENGCVTFTYVPFGSYDTDEIIQDGWINVSGLGSVNVDEPSEIFTIVNHKVINENPEDTTPPSTPIAFPVGGDYQIDQTVSLFSNDVNFDAIYYSIDGTEPTSTSTTSLLYDDATKILINKDSALKAIAYDKTGNVSDVMTENYGIAPKISGESSSNVLTTSMTITWITNDSSTSRVIYDTESHDPIGISTCPAPNDALKCYGYAFSTDEDTATTTNHSVTINNLSSGTTYYYRAVSHGSPEAVSSEQHIVSTTQQQQQNNNQGGAGGGGGGGGNGPILGTFGISGGGSITQPVVVATTQTPAPVSENIVVLNPTNEETGLTEETNANSETENNLTATALNTQNKTETENGNLLASVFGAVGNFWWLILIVFILIAVWLIKRSLKKGNQ